ncbi:uncharacterized protein LOC129742793, partial [Uranotaenia lowii]|uniref:uncharacterized protein LOC129742793 n=1 Tax=Uranotaenia lowii TaxID=190385 RepID=UPI00247858D0
TDEKFRKKLYINHQKVMTPLLKIPKLDMIEDIVVGDRLHLIDLGVMKRLLLGWRDGILGYETKLSAFQIAKMSDMLIAVKLPSEIHRKLRGMDHLAFWKASEFSSFLHYASIVVLKDFLPVDNYNHFLLLFCSITMLSSNHYKSNWTVARKMLQTFVSQYMELYGEQFLTSNVHNLIHIVDEVERFGPLSTISAYPFENALQRIKHLLRSGWKTLEQVINRLSEINSSEYYTRKPSKTLNQNFPNIRTCGKAKVLDINETFSLSNTDKNAWFLTNDNQIVRFENVVESNKLIINGRQLALQEDFFIYPFASSFLYIYVGHLRSLSKEYSKLSVDDIKCKLVSIEHKDKRVFVPLVHTIIHR